MKDIKAKLANDRTKYVTVFPISKEEYPEEANFLEKAIKELEKTNENKVIFNKKWKRVAVIKFNNVIEIMANFYYDEQWNVIRYRDRAGRNKAILNKWVLNVFLEGIKKA